MEETGLTSALCTVGVVLSLLSGVILLSFQQTKTSPRRVLGIYFLVISFAQTIIALITTGLITQFPHLFRTGVLAAYIFPPLAWLYIRENFRPGITSKDVIHFFPALFYFIDFIPFFLLPAQEKLHLIQTVTGDNIDQLFAHREGWITPPWFHMVFRVLMSLFYCLLSVRLMRRLIHLKHPVFYGENSPLVKWLWTFVVFQFLIFVPYVLLVLIGKPQYTFYTSIVPFAMIGPVTSIVLFFRPSIFYGFNGLLIESGGQRIIEESGVPEKFKNGDHSADDRSGAAVLQKTEGAAERTGAVKLDYLTEEEVTQLKLQVSTFLSTNKAYLSPSYSINDFSKEIGIPARKISAYVNHVERLNFRDFINRFRIEYCLANLHEGAWQNLTLEAIARQCGFSNRNSFTMAFKKFSGTNPSFFVSQLKQGQLG